MIRLDKYLAQTGNGTRSQVKELIKKGLVSVNGEIIKNSEYKLNEQSDEVFISGSKVNYIRYEYFMLNKPAGYVSATEDKKEKTVLELIKDKKRHDLFPVGRLDKDTEGLLIISNDGAMAHDILSPKKHVDKVYYAKIEGKVQKQHIEVFKEGIDIGEKRKTLPAELCIISSGDISEIEITIREGKYHQIKRMFLAIGMKVLYLKRIKMGNILLDESLKKGEYRRLRDEEIRALTEMRNN